MKPAVTVLFPVLLLVPFLLRSAGAAPSAPDLLLLVVDSLRPDYVGCYGQTLPTTPGIDAFAASGTRFGKAFASGPWTQPSVMSLFTSVPPDRHGRVTPTAIHATNVVTLTEALRAAGYQTVGITANPMSHRRYGFARGFEHYDDYSVGIDPDSDLLDVAAKAAAKTSCDATVTRLAEDWLRRRDPDRPLFLFLFYMDPHWDYLPPPPYNRMFTDDPVPPLRNIHTLGRTFVPPAARERIRAAYAGEIRYTDDCVARLLATLSTTPRADATAVALCADHGESFWERGLTGHGNNLHEEELHVPLAIRPPASLKSPAGAVVDTQVGLIDLAPTFLDLAGVPPPSGWEGTSLRPFLEGGSVPERPIVLDTRVAGGHLRGVRTASWKVVAKPPFEAPSEVYDLAADPGETRNLVASDGTFPPAVAPLLPLLKPGAGAK